MPPATRLYDLFGGGGAITHCAALSQKYGKVIYNDIGDIATLFRQAVSGIDKYIDTSEFITRQMFNDRKSDCPYIKYNWSFGNSGEGYMYGAELEQWKHCLHNAIFFFDVSGFKKYYGLELPVYEDIKNRRLRRLAYSAYIKEHNLESEQRLYELQSFEGLERIESLERQQNIERLQRLNGLETLEIHNKSYDEFEITEGIIYCDIPYKDTVCGSYGGFDHNAFYEWAEHQVVPVYISEYAMPDDRFKEIAAFSKRQQYNAIGSGAEVKEKIFVPKHQEVITNQLSFF